MIELLKAGLYDSALVHEKTGFTPKRITEFYEIELYVFGEGESYIDAVSYKHQKGNIIFARPGHERYSNNRFVCLYVHLNMDIKTADCLKNVLNEMKAINYELYENVYYDIIKIYNSEKRDREMLLQSKLYALFDMILNNSLIGARIENMKEKMSPNVIESAISFIEKNYHHHLTLGDIAKNAGFSPIYFHKQFTACIGMTPHEYVIKTRIESAKLLLLTTNYQITDIVEKCGFSSSSYFDYSFKLNCGITPREFRKQKYIL